MFRNIHPAAFGRLCVETSYTFRAEEEILPAAFGRLCVETRAALMQGLHALPAAFGRLCVETLSNTNAQPYRDTQPPSGGCVLKPKPNLVC